MPATQYEAQLEVELAAVYRRVSTLEENLKAIRSHTEVVAPSMYEMSTTWLLANRALMEGQL